MSSQTCWEARRCEAAVWEMEEKSIMSIYKQVTAVTLTLGNNQTSPKRVEQASDWSWGVVSILLLACKKLDLSPWLRPVPSKMSETEPRFKPEPISLAVTAPNPSSLKVAPLERVASTSNQAIGLIFFHKSEFTMAKSYSHRQSLARSQWDAFFGHLLVA